MGPRRRHSPGQPGDVVQSAPPGDPLHRLDGAHRRRRDSRVPLPGMARPESPPPATSPHPTPTSPTHHRTERTTTGIVKRTTERTAAPADIPAAAHTVNQWRVVIPIQRQPTSAGSRPRGPSRILVAAPGRPASPDQSPGARAHLPNSRPAPGTPSSPPSRLPALLSPASRPPSSRPRRPPDPADPTGPPGLPALRLLAPDLPAPGLRPPASRPRGRLDLRAVRRPTANLLPDRQTPSSSAELSAVAAQRVGEGEQGAVASARPGWKPQ